MFDELHDPNPPIGDSHQFAAVTERARTIRRRRLAAASTIGALTLIFGGALVLNATYRNTDREILTTATTEASPTTTTLGTSPPSASLPTAADPLPTSTVSSTTTVAAPSTTLAPSSAIVGEPIQLACRSQVCTYDNLADGRLVQLGEDQSVAGPTGFTIYDETGANVVASGALGTLDPRAAFLIDIGPGDIAYVWYIRRDETETARIGAFELTGPDAGRQITQFDTVLDFSGDTEQVPTRAGFVNVSCCGPDTVRPSPDADVVIPWVDADGNPIAVDDDNTFFTSEFVDQTLTITAIQSGVTLSWALPDQEAGPRGMPRLHQLDDGRVIYVFDPLHGGGAETVPVYLNPDGSVDIGESPGTIEFVIPDGRVVLRDTDTGARSLATLTDPQQTNPTQTTPRNEPADPARPLVAITADGDAVYFDTADANPALLLDGADPNAIDPGQEGPGPNLVDSVALSSLNNTGYVGECCEPVSGIVYETLLPTPVDKNATRTSLQGYGVSVSPDGKMLAVGNFAGVDLGINVVNIATGAETTYRSGEQTPFSPYETMWANASTIVVLGIGESGWELAVFDINQPALSPPRIISLPSSDGVNSSLSLAGRPNPEAIGIYESDGNDIFLVDVFADEEPALTAPAVLLPGPALSAWFYDPGQLIWVDTNRTLRVGDQIIPGEYTWARR